MGSQEATDLLYEIGERCGIAHQNVNPNDAYVDRLEMSAAQISAYGAVVLAFSLIGILVIYSIFYLSVSRRVRLFGQLRTIGTTKKQLKRMVRQEGLRLWCAAAPLGFLAGLGGMAVFGPDHGFDFSGIGTALLVSLGCSAASTLTAIRKPAKMASGISPVEAVRYTAWNPGNSMAKIRKEPRRTTSWSMARMNFRRNGKKTFMTLVSLILGGTLFLAGCILINGWDAEAYIRVGAFRDAEYVIGFDHNSVSSLPYEENEIQTYGLLNQELKDEIQDLPGVESIQTYQNVTVRFLSQGINSYDDITVLSQEECQRLEEYTESGSGTWESLSEGIYIAMSDQWEELYGEFPQTGEDFTFTFYDGEERTVTLPVVGVGSNDIRNVIPECGMMFISQNLADQIFENLDPASLLAVTMKNHQYSGQTDQLMEEVVAQYPMLNLITFSQRLEESVAQLDTLTAFVMGAGIFVIIFGLINLLNTLLSSLLTRRKELAMLAALGMTRRQVGNMLLFEALLMGAVNLAGTLVLGTNRMASDSGNVPAGCHVYVFFISGMGISGICVAQYFVSSADFSGLSAGFLQRNIDGTAAGGRVDLNSTEKSMTNIVEESVIYQTVKRIHQILFISGIFYRIYFDLQNHDFIAVKPAPGMDGFTAVKSSVDALWLLFV